MIAFKVICLVAMALAVFGAIGDKSDFPKYGALLLMSGALFIVVLILEMIMK